MVEIGLITIGALLGFIISKLQKKETSQENVLSIKENIAKTTQTGVHTLIESILAKYSNEIIHGTSDVALEAIKQVQVKVENLKLIEGQLHKVEGILNNLNAHE